MKKLTKLFAVCAVVLTAAALSGCKQEAEKDETEVLKEFLKSDTVSKNALVGTWKTGKIILEEYYDSNKTYTCTMYGYHIFKINSDNTIIMETDFTKLEQTGSVPSYVLSNMPAEGSKKIEKGIYTLTDNKLTATAQEYSTDGTSYTNYPSPQEEEVRIILKGSKLYICSYATDDEIIEYFNLFKSYGFTAQLFIDNCFECFTKQ